MRKRMTPRKENVETADDSDAPCDIDALRADLTRRLLTGRGMARRCREPICKRTRRCAGPDLRCLRDQPLRPVSEDEAARRLAVIQRLLRERIKAIG